MEFLFLVICLFLGKNPHLDLQKLVEKYGNVYGLYLGRTYTVVLKDYVIMKDLFKQLAASDRPNNLFQNLPGGVGILETNGPEWLEQRKYTIQTMKNIGFGISKWEKNLNEEVRCFLDIIAEYGGNAIDINAPLSASVSNNVLSLISGHNLPMGDASRDLVDSAVYAFESMYDQIGLITAFPKIFKLAVRLGLVKEKAKMDALAKMGRYVNKIIEDVKEENNETYIQQYWREIERRKDLNTSSYFNVKNLIGNSQSLIFAGSDTTKISLQWLYLAMAAFPHIQKNVHEELDTVLGSDELTSWQERLRLPYCHAVILEAQRWRTVVPLNVTHRARLDLEVEEFVIPKGSNIIAFIWGIHMDPCNWEHPDSFRPERFRDQDGSVKKNVQKFAPFSFGKRRCPGENIAYIEIFLYFVGMMQKFIILPPEGIEEPNLKGQFGLTLHPTPQKLRFVLR